MDNIDQKMARELDNLMSDTNVEQTTDRIREAKHSGKIKTCVNDILKIKKDYSRLPYNRIEEIAKSRCQFLLVNYRDIFFKVLKNEIDVSLLFTFVDILEKIETGVFNQHEASFQVGTILKKIYIDSALKRNEKLDKKDIKKEKQKKKKLNRKMTFGQWNEKN